MSVLDELRALSDGASWTDADDASPVWEALPALLDVAEAVAPVVQRLAMWKERFPSPSESVLTPDEEALVAAFARLHTVERAA